MPEEPNWEPRWREAVERTGYLLVRFLLSTTVLGIVVFSSIVMVALRPVAIEPSDHDLIVSVPVGATGAEIAQMLADEGLVSDARLFGLLLRLTDSASRLQAGEFLLTPGMVPMRIIEQLRTGRGVARRVVVPEGYALRQIADRLASLSLVDRNRFLELAHDATLVYGEAVPLDLPIPSLEGYLFPDTYQFVKGQTEEEIIRMMVARFLQVVPPSVQERLEDSGLELHDLVTLASIVEKEAMVDWERPLVAGVYLNRLQIGMRLQADPTVRYVMTEERSRVLYRDLEIDSPYNTYRNAGLPPGPIASPGLRSIEAVLAPADVDYLFFVSRRDGTHKFTRTFNEHVRARRELGY